MSATGIHCSQLLPQHVPEAFQPRNLRASPAPIVLRKLHYAKEHVAFRLQALQRGQCRKPAAFQEFSGRVSVGEAINIRETIGVPKAISLSKAISVRAGLRRAAAHGHALVPPG
jgi:hypothetical protein